MYSKDDQSWLNRTLRQFGEIGNTDAQNKGNKELIEKLESRIKTLEEKLSLQEIQ
jgi:hypothetical protein